MIRSWLRVAVVALVGCGAAIHQAPRKYGSGLLTPSGGTIIGVTAGGGLTGGGVAGNVTVNVGAGSGVIVAADTVSADTSYVQKRIGGSCTGANAIQTVNNDGSVVCVAAGGGSGGGGTVTSISEGAGIVATPNPITGTGTIAADTTYLQRRVSGTCGSGNAIQVVNADGTVTCQAAGTGTVTSVATTAPITGGTITSGGTLGLSESSNLRTNAGALDLSTNVTMPGTLQVKNILGTVDTQSLAAGTVTLTPSSTATVEELTCNSSTTINAMPACTAGRMLDVIATNASTGVCNFTDSASLITPGANTIPLHGDAGGRLTCTSGGVWQFTAAGSVTSVVAGTSISTSGTNGAVTVSLNHPTISCSAGQHISAVASDGTPTCSADAPTNGIAGTLTTGTHPVATGSHAIGNSLTTESGGTLATTDTTWKIGAPTSSVGTDAGFEIIQGGASTATLIDIKNETGESTTFRTGAGTNPGTTTQWLNVDGIGRTTFNQDSTFQGNVTLSSSAKTLTADGTTVFGSSWATPSTTAGQPKCSGVTPTVSACGSTTTISGTSCSGFVAVNGAATVTSCTLTWASAWTNPAPCTIEQVDTNSKGLINHYITSQSASAVTFTFSADFRSDGFNYNCAPGY